MYPHSGFGGPEISKVIAATSDLAFFCQGSTAGKDFWRNVRGGEHLRKPSFWRPPFCEPPRVVCEADLDS